MYEYPKTYKSDFSYELHGVNIPDPYQWMEDGKKEDVLAWVKEQNEYTDKYFENLEGYDAIALAKTLKENAKTVNYSEEYELNGRLFCCKTDEASKVSVVMTDMEYNELETIADSKSFDGKYIYTSCIPSGLDNGIVAVYGLEHGKPRPSIVVYDYKNKVVLNVLEGMFSWVWGKDGKTIYFSDAENDKEKGTAVNFVKAYSTDTNKTEIVYTHTEHSPFLILASSRNGDHIFIHARKDYSNCKLLTFKPGENKVVSLNPDCYLPLKYLGSNDKKHFVLSRENAPFGKIIAIDVDGGMVANAVDVIPESNKNLIGAEITPKYIMISSMVDVAAVLELYDHEGNFVRQIDLPDPMGSCGARGFGNSIFQAESNFYFGFESFIVPPVTMRYNEDTDELTVARYKKKVDVPADIVVDQVFVESNDGEKIPAFIVHKKDIVLDGSNPTLMYGYGGYALPVAPMFSNPTIVKDIYSWVDKGYVYVSCNLRGGNEYGTKWHHGGNLGNKKKCYEDFISIAQWLIDNKWSNPSKMAICGASNGGLLVTTLITMRPDLWGCVIASVPHTDMIRFMYDDRGSMYTTEYGNPREEDMFHYMMSYSPYHNVKNVKYPPIYIQTGECDNNVPPYHGKKFAARMQEMADKSNPVLLRVLKDGSHDRGRGDTLYKTTAEMQTFIAKALGL